MNLESLFFNRDKTYVRLSEAADNLSNIVRENLTIFDMDSKKSTVVFLSENDKIVQCQYKLNEDSVSLYDVTMENAQEVFSDKKLDGDVAHGISEMVRSVDTDSYGEANESFNAVIDSFKQRAMFREVRDTLDKKRERFGKHTEVSNSTALKNLVEVKDNVKSFIAENIKSVSENSDILNALRLSTVISKAFNPEKSSWGDIIEGDGVTLSNKTQKPLYEMVYGHELVRRELVEAKENFSKIWATNDKVSKLASTIFSEDGVIKEALSEVITDVPYFALASKGDVTDILEGVYDISDPGTLSKKDVKTFVSKIFDFKKPAKSTVINTLNEHYGINVYNLKFVPSFKNVASAQAVFFESLGLAAEEGSVVQKVLVEFSKFIKGKSGVQVLDVNDYIQDVFEDKMPKSASVLMESINFEAVSEAAGASVLTESTRAVVAEAVAEAPVEEAAPAAPEEDPAVTAEEAEAADEEEQEPALSDEEVVDLVGEMEEVFADLDFDSIAQEEDPEIPEEEIPEEGVPEEENPEEAVEAEEPAPKV